LELGQKRLQLSSLTLAQQTLQRWALGQQAGVGKCTLAGSQNLLAGSHASLRHPRQRLLVGQLLQQTSRNRDHTSHGQQQQTNIGYNQERTQAKAAHYEESGDRIQESE
jgi:hypothetical protein